MDVERLKAIRIANHVGLEGADQLLAKDLDEALAIIRQEPVIDLAIVDIVLRGQESFDEDGLDVIAALRSRQPRSMIIALTRQRDLPVGVRAMKMGANDFIANWEKTDWEVLLENKLAIFKALVEGRPVPSVPEPAW